jgi:hypothetical protein
MSGSLPSAMLLTSSNSPARFVHDPELVCSRGFEWSGLRKRPDVGLRLVSNVATSMACPGPPKLSLVKVGPSEGPHGVTHLPSLRHKSAGPLTFLSILTRSNNRVLYGSSEPSAGGLQPSGPSAGSGGILAVAHRDRGHPAGTRGPTGRRRSQAAGPFANQPL